MSRLYVSNISSKANMEDVHDLFMECGKLKSFNIQDGCGYIEAEDAIKKLHSKEVCGQDIIVEPSRKISSYRMRGRNRMLPRRNHTRYHPRGRSSSPRHDESNSRSQSRSKSKPRSRSRSDSRRNKHHHHKRHRSRHSRYSESSGSD